MSLWTLPNRWAVLGVSILIGCLFVGGGTLLLSERAAILLLDKGGTIFPYPFTIQNLMHLLFFIGLGELYMRWRVSVWEEGFLSRRYLPEDDETVLQAKDLGPIRRQVANEFDGENGFLPSLIDLCILQFYSSRSVDQTVSVLNSSLELIAHRVDLRYSISRYLVWVIPTFGFIGTVVGIATTLGQIDPDPAKLDLKVLTGTLGIAFDTTLIALILAAILVLFLHVVQKKEEQSVNLAGNYCLRNLINRLYVEEN